GRSIEHFEIVVTGLNDRPEFVEIADKVSIVEDGSEVMRVTVRDEETALEELVLRVESTKGYIESPTYRKMGEGVYEVDIVGKLNETREDLVKVVLRDGEGTEITEYVKIEIASENDRPEIEKGLKLTLKQGESYESEIVVSDVEESRGEQMLEVKLKDSSEFSIEKREGKYVVKSDAVLTAATYSVIVEVTDGVETLTANYDIVVEAVMIAPSIETLVLGSATEDSAYAGEILISDNRIESVMIESIVLPSWMEADKEL
ncbi:uncharacterized protein METZ01_LOCUS443706, partial [marine metagenome]